jgi:hypothetical protein
MRQLLIILFLACSACSASAPVAPAKAPSVPAAAAPAGTEDAATLLIRMRSMVGAASCSENAQCQTVAVGARACGGPEGYIAYSTKETQRTALEALARRHAEKRRAAVSASGELSTCNFIPDPGAVCRAGSCQLRSAANDPT